MKKLLAPVLASVLIAIFAACANSGGGDWQPDYARHETTAATTTVRLEVPYVVVEIARNAEDILRTYGNTATEIVSHLMPMIETNPEYLMFVMEQIAAPFENIENPQEIEDWLLELYEEWFYNIDEQLGELEERFEGLDELFETEDVQAMLRSREFAEMIDVFFTEILGEFPAVLSNTLRHYGLHLLNDAVRDIQNPNSELFQVTVNAAVIAFANVQANARMAVTNADANAIASALNAYNAFGGNQITTTAEILSHIDNNNVLTLTVPARGVMEGHQFVVTFSTHEHAIRAVESLEFSSGIWVVRQ